MLNLMTPQAINDFFRRLAAADPEPKTELKYINTYTLLVAVVLSAQATDTGVNKATKDLFAKVKTPAQMLVLGERLRAPQVAGVGAALIAVALITAG